MSKVAPGASNGVTDCGRLHVEAKGTRLREVYDDGDESACSPLLVSLETAFPPTGGTAPNRNRFPVQGHSGSRAFSYEMAIRSNGFARKYNPRCVGGYLGARRLVANETGVGILHHHGGG